MLQDASSRVLHVVARPRVPTRSCAEVPSGSARDSRGHRESCASDTDATPERPPRWTPVPRAAVILNRTMQIAHSLVRHFLAAIAYRTQKALRGAPPTFGAFAAGERTRTPAEILRHMTSLLGYARTFVVGGEYPVKPDPLPTMDEEIARFHEVLESVGELLGADGSLGTLGAEQLLQGPLADVMTHVGQLAMLRRLAGSPVAPENFIFADVRKDRLGRTQAEPARPDAQWPERPR